MKLFGKEKALELTQLELKDNDLEDVDIKKD